MIPVLQLSLDIRGSNPVDSSAISGCVLRSEIVKTH